MRRISSMEMFCCPMCSPNFTVLLPSVPADDGVHRQALRRSELPHGIANGDHREGGGVFRQAEKLVDFGFVGEVQGREGRPKPLRTAREQEVLDRRVNARAEAAAPDLMYEPSPRAFQAREDDDRRLADVVALPADGL